MIGEHWTPGGAADARLRRLQGELLGLATTATMTADEDDFEGVLSDEHRALVRRAVEGVTEAADRAVDHQLDGQPFEVTMIGYAAGTSGVYESPAEPPLHEAVERLREACARWWRRLDELGLAGDTPVPHPDRPGTAIDDLIADLLELTAIAVGEVTALLELRT